MTTIDKTFNGKKIQAKKGDVVQIELAENSTSGYLWKISSLNTQHLDNTNDNNQRSGNAPGAGGLRTFKIKVLKEGTSELQIKLGNQWENDTVDTFSLTIES